MIQEQVQQTRAQESTQGTKWVAVPGQRGFKSLVAQLCPDPHKGFPLILVGNLNGAVNARNANSC
jgi:hypothetical protein